MEQGLAGPSDIKGKPPVTGSLLSEAGTLYNCAACQKMHGSAPCCSLAATENSALRGSEAAVEDWNAVARMPGMNRLRESSRVLLRPRGLTKALVQHVSLQPVHVRLAGNIGQENLPHFSTNSLIHLFNKRKASHPLIAVNSVQPQPDHPPQYTAARYLTAACHQPLHPARQYPYIIELHRRKSCDANFNSARLPLH